MIMPAMVVPTEIVDPRGRRQFAGHAHLDLAWFGDRGEARIEALDTARAAVELLEEHPSARVS